MKIIVLTALVLFLSSCLTLPTSTPIHDDFITLVSKDSDLGVQILYKNEKLKHYKLNGIDAYCKAPSMDKSLYRCFSIEGNRLIKGFNSRNSSWEMLSEPVYVVQKPL